MYQVITVIHVLLGMGIIGLIMIQQGKGADAGASFGSGSSASVFGAQGAGSFLTRTTAIFAALFFTTSLGLAILGGKQGANRDIMKSPAVEQQKDTALPSAAETIPEMPVPPVPVAAPQQTIPAPAAIEPIKPVEPPKPQAAQPTSEAKQPNASSDKQTPKK